MGRTNEEILGLGDHSNPGQKRHIQLPNGDMLEVTAGEYTTVEKMDQWERLAWMNKKIGEQELAYDKMIHEGSNNLNGEEEWINAMKFIGRAQ